MASGSAAQAKAGTGMDILQQIDELRQEAGQAAQEAEQLLRQLQEKMNARNDALRRLAEIAGNVADEDVSTLGNIGGGIQTGGGRNGGTANAATGTGKKRGRPKGSTNKADKPARERKSGDKRNFDNEVSLKETVFNVLSRSASQHRKSLPDYPKDAVGLKVSEITEIIGSEGLWKSSSDKPGQMIQQALYHLKNDNKVERDDETRRYRLVQGATYN